MKILHSDVLVIGGGLAGLRTAIGARRRGLDVSILSLVPPKRSHSATDYQHIGMQDFHGSTSLVIVLSD